VPDLNFAAEFPEATEVQWRGLVEKVLKGAAYEAKLVSHSADGLRIEPLYAKAEGAPPRALRAQAGRWGIVQRVDHPEPLAANGLALTDLENGASGLVLVFSGAPRARGFGLRADRIEDLEAALNGVMIDLVHLRLEAGALSLEMGQNLLTLAQRRGLDPKKLDLDLAADPIGVLLSQGGLPEKTSEDLRKAAELAVKWSGDGFEARVFLADSRPLHEAGASEAQELAYVLANALSFLRALEALGADLNLGRRMLSFLLVADADEFLTLAKFRALRRLWTQIELACGLTPEPIRLHAETAWRMCTRHDPWVNILRDTVAAFSAALGGADSIHVLPFTAPLGLSDDFARRIARNTQIILTDEANLWRVADPAAGSGAFEALTEALSQKAWAILQTIESDGGLIEYLQKGKLQKEIASVAAERAVNIARRKLPITGTSEFPNLAENPVNVLMPAPEHHEGAVESGLLPLQSRRDAEPFELLRAQSASHLATQGQRAQIFLANFGPLAAFSARSGFAKNFFEASGIEALGNPGFAAPAALIAAFKESKALIACLCSSDAIYATEAEGLARELKAADCKYVILAGRPGEREVQLRAAGVDGFIYAGCNILELPAKILANLFGGA
jgi:methylmalonyl-CoA mutase